MAQTLNPYITFDGDCADAMAFYCSVLGGTVQTSLFRDFGMDIDGVMHASLETPAGFTVFASDHADGMGEYQRGTNVQISISGDEGEVLEGYWAGLSEGGQPVIPLEPQAWGDVYGQLVDKFGIVWHINIAGQQG